MLFWDLISIPVEHQQINVLNQQLASLNSPQTGASRAADLATITSDVISIVLPGLQNVASFVGGASFFGFENIVSPAPGKSLLNDVHTEAY